MYQKMSVTKCKNYRDAIFCTKYSILYLIIINYIIEEPCTLKSPSDSLYVSIQNLIELFDHHSKISEITTHYFRDLQAMLAG